MAFYAQQLKLPVLQLFWKASTTTPGRDSESGLTLHNLHIHKGDILYAGQRIGLVSTVQCHVAF
jgi:hypothetical protein